MDKLLEQLFEYLRGMWNRRFWGIVAAWLVAVVGIVYVLFTPARYEASARVFVDTQSVLKPLMVGLTVQPNNEQQVKMLADSLLSRPNLEQVLGMVGVDQKFTSERDRNKLIQELSEDVQLSRSEKNNMFSLSYRNTDPVRAKRVIDSLLSIFVESSASARRHDTNKALAFLDRQIADYEAILKTAETRLKEFKLKNIEHLTSASDSVGGMLALESEIDRARAELRSAQQRRDVLRRQLATEEPIFVSDSVEPGTRATPASDSLSELDARAIALRRNLDELLRNFTEQHPDVVGTRRILADLARQRETLVEARRNGKALPPVSSNARRLPNPVYQQLKVSVAEAEATVAGLSDRVANMESRYNRMLTNAKLEPQFEEQLAQLNRDYQVHKTNFEQLVQRREQAKMTGDLDATGSVDFRVIDPPKVLPVGPNRLRLLLAALGLSLAAGVAGSFVASQAFPTISTISQLGTLTEMPVLGAVSRWPSPAALMTRQRNQYVFFGAVTGLFALFAIALTVSFIAARMG